MDTAYNRRIASANDAIMERYARHAPTNFVGRGYGSDSGIDTQYNDVMRGAANHPRALSRAEKEYRMEGGMASFGGSFLDDLGQAFRYTPVGMVADAAQGRDTVLSGRGNFVDDMRRGLGGNFVDDMRQAVGGSFLDDLGQAFRYTPVGMVADAAQGRDTVLSGRGKLTITHGGADGVGGAMCGGNSYANVGVTMPFREVPYAGVMDFANPLSSGSGKPKFPLVTKVQVGNSDGSGRPLDKAPQVEAAWYESMDDFVGGRNRMRDSKKVGRMTKDPELVANGGRDFTTEELKFVEDLLMKGGAGFYGGEWYNDWGDFTEAVKGAYDTVVGVYEDYVKPVLDVVGTPLKDALLSSGNPYGEAGAGFLELLGYGQNGMSGGMDMMEILEKKGAPVGGMYGVSSGRSGGRMMKGSPEMKAHMAKLRAMKGKGIGRMKGCGEGVFAEANPIRANSLGFSPKLEVEQLNAATGSTSYGDMPSSNPVGSGMGCGMGGRKRKIVPKNSRGVSSAPSKMGELEGGISYQDILDLGRRGLDNIIIPSATAFANAIVSGAVAAPSAVAEAARGLKRAYNRQDVQVLLTFAKDNIKIIIPFLPAPFAIGSTALLLLKAYFDTPAPRPATPPMREDEDDVVVVGRGKKKIPSGFHRMPSGQLMRDTPDCPHSKGGSKLEREGLAITGDNSMGSIVAERGFSKKAQSDAGAVELVAKDNLYDGEKFETSRGRSGKKINNLILNGVTKGVSQGGAMSGGAHALTQTNNLQAVYGGSMDKMKKEYSGKGAHGGKSAYNLFVSETMKKTGMKLAEAVKHIKANGLYKK